MAKSDLMELVVDIDEKEQNSLFVTDGAIEKLLSKITKHANAHEPDITTSKGRSDIKTLAASIARNKVALDNLGADVKSEWQAKVNGVDAKRRVLKKTLDDLKTATRQPLTSYEDEIARLDKEVDDDLYALVELKNIPFGADRELVTQRLADLTKIKGRNDWRGKEQKADDLLEAAKIALDNALQMIEQAEIMAAERARMEEERAQIEKERAEEAEKQKLAQEEIARQNALAVEQQRQKEAESNRKIAELQAEADKLRDDKERALREAEEQRLAHQQAIEDEKQRLIDQDNEQKRILAENEKAERQAEEEKKIANELAVTARKRQQETISDIAKRSNVSNEIGATILDQIKAGNIRHVSFN